MLALAGAITLMLTGCSAKDAVVTVRVGSSVQAPVHVEVVDEAGATVFSETLRPGESDRVEHIPFGHVKVEFGQLCSLQTTVSVADREILATLDQSGRCAF